MRKKIQKNAINLFLFHLVLVFCMYNISKAITPRKPKGSKKRKSFDARGNSCLSILKSLQFPS